MKKILFLAIITVLSCHKNSFPDVDFRQEMRDFVSAISTYAKSSNPGFIIIPQNGIELVEDAAYLSVIDGVGQEELFYGYKKDGKKTPADVTEYLTGYLNLVKNAGKQVLVTDYCTDPGQMDLSFTENRIQGYISFAADHRELDNIPSWPGYAYQENADSIHSIQEAKNFLYLLDNEPFPSKQAFIQAIANTNYDLILTDLFYRDDTAFSAQEVEQLRQKANGGKRLVICYMSIGEAEDYRYYWQSSWKKDRPEWMEKENPNWKGNFKVQYWDPEWQAIIFGNDSSYLKKMLDAGFDGVYLDIIDAFEYFE